jgi:hypothetical protein
MNSFEYKVTRCISLKIFDIYTAVLEKDLGFAASARLLALSSPNLSET